MNGDPHARLIRALASHAGPGATLVRSSVEPWASVTFAGMRHHLTFRVEEADADRLGCMASDALTIPGHLLVDLAEVARRPAPPALLVEIDALTLEKG